VGGKEDPHLLTADIMRLGERERAPGVIESKRQRGKTANYMMLYGGGVTTVMETFGVSESEARRMIDAYYRAYPEISELQRDVRWAIEDRGYVKTPWGRRHRLKVQEAYKAVNALVQGTAADLLKASLVRLHQEGAPVVACVHDEIVLHCPEADAESWGERLVTAMTDHPRITRLVPLEAEYQVVDRWSEAKDPSFSPPWGERTAHGVGAGA
jgi:DNA polymerase-1